MFRATPFGRYLLIDKIATGGMAEIFLAKLLGAEGFEKKFALKKILPVWSQDQEFTSMLIDEAKISVQLVHPNIVQVHELVRHDNSLGIVMEFVDGIDLRKIAQQLPAGEKIPLEIGLFILSEVLNGLSFAHPLGIIHRDISPQNILLSFDGQVKITDFGIAKAASRSHETASGVLKGKFAYMSPEQASQGAVDSRSDLFSAAILLYETVTGERLFARGSDLDTLERVRRAQIDFSPGVEKKIPPALKEILLKGLAKEPENRFQDAASFAEAIGRFARKSKKQLSSQKLAAFLSKIFQEERKKAKSEETRRVPAEELNPTEPILEKSWDSLTKEIPMVLFKKEPQAPRRPLVWTAIPVLAIGIIVAVLLKQPKPLSSGLNVANPVVAPVVTSSPTPQPAENFPPIQGNQVLSGKEKPALASAGQAAPSFGFLNVQAIPWGHVEIEGEKPLETPIRRLKLSQGTHHLSVSSLNGTALTASIMVEGGKETTCVADFHHKGIQCRN